jgi:RNA polymerase sigma-70 factor (ECF subfamily)
MNTNKSCLKDALNGDIVSFQKLFCEFQNQLKSYLYRLLVDRNDAEDIAHDTFVRAFDKISQFKGESSLKTWVFQIATNLAYGELRKRKRWESDAQDKSREYAISSEEIKSEFRLTHETSPYGAYEIREHIDFCFTCIAKTLVIDQQVTLILKDIYDFPINDIAVILGKSPGVIKHLLHDSRKTMTVVFENRCALINKNGMCHQCSELNGYFNPKLNQQRSLASLELVSAPDNTNSERLFEIRTLLVKAIDPLKSDGADLQDMIMKCTRIAIGEISIR